MRIDPARAADYQKLYPLAVEDCRAVAKAAPGHREAIFGLIEALAAVEKRLYAKPDDVRENQFREHFRKQLPFSARLRS
ncbi:MAG: hypothetical protein IT452_16710 [Planctomycetia bacterium]|nr:hypothetical protein [Planctomycetia bacterium]